MPNGMIFKRHPPGREDPWDFNPGSRLISLNDIRTDAETRALILDLFTGAEGGGTTILVVGDVLGGDGVTVDDNGDGTITITVQVGDLPELLELIRDTVNASLDPGTAITITPNDGANLVTIGVDLTNAALLEMIRDTISTALVEGTGINIVVDDGANTISVALDEVDAEVIRDTMAAVLVEGTGISLVVDDPGNTITVNSTVTAYTDEQALDAVGGALLEGGGVKITVDDGSNTISLAGVGRDVSIQTGTSYTLIASDAWQWLSLGNASAITLTVPPNSDVAFPIGTEIEGHQEGAGQVTITPGSGVTVNGTPGLLVAEQYGVFGIKKVATDTWVAYGRLSA